MAEFWQRLIFPIEAIHVGPVVVQLPGLLVLLGYWAAVWIAARAGKRLGLDPDRIYSLGFYAAIAGVIGARLGYAATHAPAYAADPLAIISLNLSALSGPAGVLAAAVTGVVHARRARLPRARLLDALAPGLAMLIAAVSAAQLFSGEAYGIPSTLPWSIQVWDTERHPVQAYEALAALVILAVLLAMLRRPSVPGTPALVFVALYAGQRVFLEAFRAGSPLLPGGWRAIQIAGLVVLGITLLALKLPPD